jgi:hypothetical protein
MFILHPEDKSKLQWISEKKSPVKSRINLEEVSRLILFGITEETKRLNRIKQKVKRNDKGQMLSLAVVTKERSADIELVFDSERDMKLFVTGLQVLIKEVKGNTNLKDYKEMKLR